MIITKHLLWEGMYQLQDDRVFVMMNVCCVVVVAFICFLINVFVVVVDGFWLIINMDIMYNMAWLYKKL